MTTFSRPVTMLCLISGLTACAGNVGPSTTLSSGAFEHPNATLTVFPHRLTLDGLGAKHAKTFVVKEAGYTGSFNYSETYGCIQAATLAPSVAQGPKTKYTLTGKKKISGCKITFMDTKSQMAVLKFSVL